MCMHCATSDTCHRRGEEFSKNGDIAAARLFLRRAANAGNGQAALALGATFDPLVLSEQGVVGPAGRAAGPRLVRASERAWIERSDPSPRTAGEPRQVMDRGIRSMAARDSRRGAHPVRPRL